MDAQDYGEILSCDLYENNSSNFSDDKNYTDESFIPDPSSLDNPTSHEQRLEISIPNTFEFVFDEDKLGHDVSKYDNHMVTLKDQSSYDLDYSSGFTYRHQYRYNNIETYDESIIDDPCDSSTYQIA